ncbi:MAG TPA: outer membrane beta-barrel protein, partial [Chitinophagaceae bacterium]|nr:outer membrane beta-barrel protein [Chitinophagaceae bacterium]
FAPSQQHQLGVNFTRKISRPNIELLFPGRTYNNQNFFTENNPFLQPILYNNLEFSYTLKSQSTFLVSYSNAQNAFAGFVIPVAENGVSKLKSTYLNYGHINSLDFTFNTYQHVVKDKWDIVFSPTYNYSRYTGTVLSGPVAVSNSSYTLFFDNYVYLSNKRRWKAFLTFKYNSATKDISGRQLNATSSLDFMMIKGIKKFALYFMVNDIYNGKSIIKTDLYANSLLSRNHTETNSYSRSVSFKIRYSFGNNQLKRNRNKNAANDEKRNRAGK